MAVNDKIRVPDYNNIQSKVAGVLGGGSSASGYGQTVRSSAVTVSNKVSVNDWGNLRYDIINAYTHIFGSAPTTTLPTTSQTIRYSTSFTPETTGTIDAPNTQYDTWANTIIANRFTIAAGQSATGAAGVTNTIWPGPYGSYWTSKITCTVSVEWPTANEARYFFNSGGEIRFASSRSNVVGGLGNSQSTAWTSILSSAGTRAFGGNKPGTGTTPNDGTNFYRCTNTYGVWYSVFGSSPYGDNNYRISARTPDVSNNSTGSAKKVDFLIEFIDNYVDPGQHPSNPIPDYIDQVDGNFSISVSYLYATGVLEPTGAGNFTVTIPTFTIGAIVP